MSQKTALIIGAGPAGLTAAYELATRTDVRPVVLEQGDMVGGIARTVRHQGNRIDIGGHRFFSKSDRVMSWWLGILPIERGQSGVVVSHQGRSRALAEGERAGKGPDPEREDCVMLVRERRSRIYYLRRFFDYPVSLSLDTLKKLGPARVARIGASYLRATLAPIRPERNLEEFFINRFGRELYLTFFKDYTEKVWGTRCSEISAEWGAQRVKGLDVKKVVWHNVRKLLPGRRGKDVSQKATETSLIERFLYPKFGPGQLWEEVARRLQDRGGEIRFDTEVVALDWEGQRITGVEVRDRRSGRRERLSGEFVFSSMPVKDLVRGMRPAAPGTVREVAAGLVYRDFITVGLLLKALRVREPSGATIRDNWIYIQEPDVRVGRLQIFNNWSPYMVADPSTVWVGLEYFCDEGDDLWSRTDAELRALAAEELERIGMIEPNAVLDSVVLRVEKTYPAYFGTYDRFPVVREFLDRFENLFLVGRNGMHRYNNQDHSMLTAMAAVDAIIAGRTGKEAIWAVNTEEEYHEQKPG